MPSTTAARGGRPRRSQEERSAATRAALLDATIEVLADEGYAALTVTKVAARAGVTRGAQVHHFASRDALVAEAIGRLAERLTAETAQALRGHPNPALGDALDLLWESFRGPVFQAVIQFSVAAPDEPLVRESLHLLDKSITRAVQEFGPAVFAGAAERTPDFDDAVFTAFNAMSGLALTYRVTGMDDELLAVRWARTKAQLLRLFDLPAPGLPAPGQPTR